MSNDPRVAIEAGDTLENLVDQFSDQFAFIRELIQNSIDAGSTQVYVNFESRPTNEGNCIFILHVEDTGEGMTREIIDTQLTRLFSSSKENDLTKIGKFGIGFVSVFALKPEAVVLDTGRDGESWRIFFKKDKSFDRIILDQPVDGTKIQAIYNVTPAMAENYKSNITERIQKWCKHSEAEILVDGEVVNQQFELTHPLAVYHEAQGTSISLAPSSEDRPFLGFYNRGLTLYEGNEAVIEGVTFKIRSRYLEHTLTRDNIIKDKNYEKAMSILQEAVNKKLTPNLFHTAAKVDNDALLGYLSYRLHKLPEELMSLPIVPLVKGDKVSLRDLKKEAGKHKELFYDSLDNHVIQALSEDDRRVIRWRGQEVEPGLGRLLRMWLPKTPLYHVNQAYGKPELVKDLSAKDKELLEVAARLLNRAGSPYRQLVPADFGYAGSGMSDRIYLAQNAAGELQRLDGKEKKGILGFLFGKSTGKTVVLNVRHPLVAPHFELRPKFPALIAYMLAKVVVIDDGIDPVTESKLLEAVLDEAPALDEQLKGV